MVFFPLFRFWQDYALAPHVTSSLGRDFLCAQRHVVDANIIDQAGEEGAGAHHQQPVYWQIADRAGKISGEDAHRISWIWPLSQV